MKNKLMLAITKIGDLLLENKITSLEEKPEWKDIYLDIPSYQRPYKWTTKNVNQLIDDIDESMKAGKELEKKYHFYNGKLHIILIVSRMYRIIAER